MKRGFETMVHMRTGTIVVGAQAQTLLMPAAAHRQPTDLPGDLWTRINIEFYKDAPDAVFKALVE